MNCVPNGVERIGGSPTADLETAAGLLREFGVKGSRSDTSTLDLGDGRGSSRSDRTTRRECGACHFRRRETVRRNLRRFIAAVYSTFTRILIASAQTGERMWKSQEEARQRAQEEARRAALGPLLNTYIAHLEQLRKSSAKDVKNIFKNHVFDANPALVLRKAADITVDDFVALISTLVKDGKGRTAGKLRSFLRSAYELAIRSKTDPALPQAMRTFGIVVNPLASTAALSQFNRTRNRHLNALELSAFLRRLDGLSPGAKKDALALCLDLGGQRPTQLLRARETDVDLPGGTLTLYDPKGARAQPRVHMLPLTESASKIVKRRLDALQLSREEAKREEQTNKMAIAGFMWLFSSDDRTAIREETISELVKDISAEMVKAGEARESFQLRDLRRTVETTLARLGTGPNIRAEVQSHGLGGVQKRHYDQHDYLGEKRVALELWGSHLAALRAGKPDVLPASQENEIAEAVIETIAYTATGRAPIK